MKKILAIALLLTLIPISAEASGCPQGGFTEYENGESIQICFTEEDSIEHAKWYQSIVGIPVWNGPIDSNGKPIGLPAGEPYVLAKDLPPMPKPKGIRTNTTPTPIVNTSPIITKPAPIVFPTITPWTLPTPTPPVISPVSNVVTTNATVQILLTQILTMINTLMSLLGRG